MITVLGYLMITSFMVLVIKKKLEAFTGLVVCSVVAGVIACTISGIPVTEILIWIREGLFYTVDDSGKVTLGTMNTTVMMLFAILYFTIMMNAGLFDPLCTFLIRKAKGDPLKVMLVTVLTASIVTLDGDGTTTTLIITTAFLPLFRQMKMKLSHLAMMIILPTSLGNCLPWGGPLARAAAVINIEINELFAQFLPVLVVAEIYIIILAVFLGKSERKRLGYVAGNNQIISHEQIEDMCRAITENDKEYKRPKLFIFNLILTVSILVVLIMGLISGAVIFTVGTAIALAINYGATEQRNRIIVNGGDAVSVTSIIIAAGIFMGILNGSGMANAIALHLTSLIPEAMGEHIAFIFSFIGAVACYSLPIDAYYFGILPVVTPIAGQFGISPLEICMSALMGQALRYGSPLVAFLYLLIDRTELSFGEYQKNFFKYATPMFGVFILTALAFGMFPL